MHHKASEPEIPNQCVAGGLAIGGGLVSLAAHHGSGTVDMPPLHCIAGGVAGLGAAAYGLSQHASSSSNRKIPTECWVYSAVGVGILLLGTKLVQSA